HFDREQREECRFNDRPSKIVERAWYFGREQREEGREEQPHHGDECCDHDHDPGHHPGHGDKPGRPTRPPGVDTGRLGDGTPLNPGDINGPNIPGVWVGPRSEMDLPYLFMRANSGDLGKRPVSGAPFWESPDIFL